MRVGAGHRASPVAPIRTLATMPNAVSIFQKIKNFLQTMPKLRTLPLGPTPSPSSRIRNALNLWVMWVVSFMSVSFTSGLPGVGHVGHVGHGFLIADRVCVGHVGHGFSVSQFHVSY